MAQLDFPTSPTPGQVYAAPNGVNYTWDNTIGIGVWTAAAGTPLSISNPGTISGSAQVGGVLSYTTGTATDGVPPYGYTWQWKKASDNSVLASNTANYTIPPALLGDRVYVELTATDAASATATATTPNYPAPPAVIDPVGVTNAVVPSTIPGTASFTWADGPQSLTATGCVEFSVNGGVSFGQGPTAVSNGNTVITQWIDSAPCGQAANGTSITGTLTDGTNTSSFSFTINRVPSAFSLAPNTESTTPSTITANDPSFTLSGGNTAPLVWGVLTGGGSAPQFSIDGGTTWVALPATPTAGVTVPQGVAAIVRFTTSGSAGTETLDVFAGASTTAGEYHSALFTVTVASSPFPNSTFTPSGAPNASPASVSTGSLHGTASCSNWADGSVSLSSTGGIQFQVNGGGYGTGPTAVANGNTVDVIWDPTVIAGAADGAILNGTLTDGVNTNTYTITVSRAVTGLSFTDLTNQALSTAVTSNVITPAGFNVPVSLSYVGSANAMTAIGVAVGGGGFAASPQTVNPGQTLQVQGTTGGTISTPYGVTLTMGSGPVATDTWTATTVAATPAVTTPSISTPSDGSTGVGTPSGITITSSAYAASGGAGTHASSDWELYAGGYPLTSTNKITGVGSTTASGWASVSFSGVGYGFQSAAWGTSAGRFVAITTGTQSAYSSDGTSWFAGGALPAISWGQVTWAPSLSLFVAVGGDSTTSTVATSPNGSTWTSRTAQIGNWNSVSWSPELSILVAVGARGTGSFNCMTSPDGITWTGIGSLANQAWRSVTWSPSLGKFVAVNAATAPYVAVSSNGTTWSQAGITGTVACDSVAWSPSLGKFVATGGGSYMTSPDGITWTSGAAPVTPSINALIWADGLSNFVGVSPGLTNPRVMVSPNGTSWSTPALQPLNSGTDQFYTVAWSPTLSKLVILGTNSKIQESSDAGIVNTVLTIANCQTEGFLVGDTVISDPTAGGPATILSLDNTQVTVTSSTGWLGNSTQSLKRDPASYSLASSATADTVNLVSWPVAKPPLTANTTYYTRVRYTSNATVVTSDWSGWSEFTTGSLIPTATTWVSQTTGTTVALYGSAFGNGVFIAAGGGTPSSSSGLTLSSPDGVNWTTRYNVAAGSGQLNGAVYGGGLFVAVGGSGVIISSPDGVTWTTQTSGTPSDFNKVAYNGSQYLAVQGATANVFTSPDAVTWTSRATGASGWQGAAWNGSVWCIVGASGRVRTSPDAITWTARTSGVAVILQDVVYTGSQFVAIGQSGTIITSPDGITWTARTSGSTAVLNNICYGGGLLVVTGNGGVILTSTDGITWTSQTSGTAQSLYQTSYSGSMFAASGSGGNVFTSVS